MTIQETKAHIKGRIWKAIAQSQLDLSPLPTETLEQLINTIVDASLVEIDTELEQVDTRMGLKKMAMPADDEPEREHVLWEGRPFLSITKHYRITNERIRITEGLFGKKRIDIELIKIQDINQTQRISERMMNLGDITVNSHDPSNPTITLDNVADVQRVHEILRRAMLDAREKANFSYREEM